MFNELVDRAVHVAGRPDNLADIVYHANETMRDISKRHDWDDDTREVRVDVLDPSSPTLWIPPEGDLRFRQMEYVEYDEQCEPTRVKPSRRIRNLCDYYYRAENTFVFVGAKSFIKIFYYVYQPWLQYYPKENRPSEFQGGLETWTNEPQNELVTNWILKRHNEVVLAGTLARFFASKQDPRQQVHYSQFEQRVTHMIRSEGVEELLGRRHG